LIEPSLAGADDRPAADVSAYAVRAPKAGYWYRALLHERESKPAPDRFAATAHPDVYRDGMRYAFVVSEQNTIYRFDFKRKVVPAFYPADPPAQGWTKLD